MIICHSHDIHHSLWRNLSRQNCLTMEINRASNLLENQIGYLEALCFISDTNLFHPPATNYLTPVVKKHEVGMVTVNPKVRNREASTDPNPTSGGFPKHKGNARTLRILETLPQIESIRLAYHSQVDPGDPGLGRCHNTME